MTEYVTDGRRIIARDSIGDPDGMAVLFFHGGGQTRHAWGDAVQAVAREGYCGVTFDLPGHGESDWAESGNYDLEMFSGSVARLIAEFRRPIVVGASLGGQAALTAVGERLATVSALVLVDVTPRLALAGVRRVREFMTANTQGFESLEAAAAAVAQYSGHRKKGTDSSGLTKNLRRESDGRWVWHWDPALLGDVSAHALGGADDRFPESRLGAAAAAVDVPTLLVRGADSDVVGPEQVAALTRLIPHAQVVEVADAGHMVAGDRNARFNEEILAFVRRVAA